MHKSSKNSHHSIMIVNLSITYPPNYSYRNIKPPISHAVHEQLSILRRPPKKTSEYTSLLLTLLFYYIL